MTNRPHGVLYVGVTSNLPKRVYDHRSGTIPGFTKRYNLHRLVYCEPHQSAEAAIAREKAIKKWNRAWKIKLIESVNPGWMDLYPTLMA